MTTQLWSFLGMSDRTASAQAGGAPGNGVAADLGPLARALLEPATRGDELHVIDDRAATGEMQRYLGWLAGRLAERGVPMPAVRVHADWPGGASPANLAAVTDAAIAALDSAPLQAGDRRLYSLSSGTSMMTIVLMLLAHSTSYAGRAFVMDRGGGVEWVEVPARLREMLRG